MTTLNGFDEPHAAILPLRLRGNSLDSRLIEEAPAELVRMRGIVAQLDDGSWVCIRHSRGKKARIVTPAGESWVEATALSDRLTGRAVEFFVALRLGAGGAQLARNFVSANVGYFAPTFLVSVAVAAAVAIPPLVLRWGVDQGIHTGNTAILRLSALGLFTFALWYAWLTWLRSMVVHTAKAAIERQTSRGLMRHVLQIPFAQADRYTIGELMQAFFGAQVFRDLVVDRSIAIVFDVVTLVTSLAVAAWLVPQSLILFMPAIAAIAAITGMSASTQARLRREELQYQSAQRSLLVELLQNVAALKAAAAEVALTDRWHTVVRSELNASFERQKRAALYDAFTQAFVQGATVAVVGLAGIFALTSGLTPGTLLAVAQLGAGVLACAAAAAGSVSAAVVAGPQVGPVLRIAAIEAAPAKAASSVTRSAAVIVENVWFRHESGTPWVLRDVSFRLAEGAKQRVSGPSGVGKSTLLRLIAGLYEPERGRIALGASHTIVFIPQRARIFSGTILQNLRRYSADACDDELFRAADDIGLGPWVRSLPMAYYTPVGPGGMAISGGQRQLIALAGALAAPRSVLLLDEPSSSLDAATSEQVFANSIWQSKTVVFVTHAKTLFADAPEYNLASDACETWRSPHA